MHSILGRESFCRNDCFNAAWHGGNQPVALLRSYGGPGCFDSGLKLDRKTPECWVLRLSTFSSQYPTDSLWGSGQESWQAN